jgi:hypothetical protein
LQIKPDIFSILIPLSARKRRELALMLALLGLIALPSLAAAAVGPIMSGTRATAFPLNNDNSARPGDTITYTAAISNATGTKVLDFWEQRLTRFFILPPVPATNRNSLVAVVKHSFKPTTALL